MIMLYLTGDGKNAINLAIRSKESKRVFVSTIQW